MRRSLDDIQDELLVFRCQDGEADALSELVERWNGRLVAHACRLTGERENAAEAVQEAWMAIVRGIRRLDDPARFRSWAYRIVTHKAVDRVRLAKRQRRTLHAAARSAEAPAAVDQMEEADDVALLRAGLARLSGDRRAILTMFYLEEMPLTEIAEALGVPVGTVKSRLHHARLKLKEELEQGLKPIERESHVGL
jgi:RNA polymerase sigma factor (sigma-70 family)